MADLSYPDYLYTDALARQQKPAGAYNAAKLYAETEAIALRQDRSADPLPSILADMRALLARLELYATKRAAHSPPPNCDGWRVTGTGPDFAIEREPYLASFSPNPHPMAAEVLRGPEDRL